MLFASFLVSALFATSVSALATPRHGLPLHNRHVALARARGLTARSETPLEAAAHAPRSLKKRCKPRRTSSSSSAPAATSSQDAGVNNVAPAPTTTSESAASTTSAAQPDPTTSSAAPPPPPPAPSTSSQDAPAPSPSPSQSSGGGGGDPGSSGVYSGQQTGQGTFYSTGLGACGITNVDTDFIAAVATTTFDNFPGYNGVNPNTNPICGRKIQANYQGKSVTVTVTDRCGGCKPTDLDFSPSAFSQLADFSLGRLSGVTWTWQ